MNGLILLGGGARGAYQAGAIKALREYGIPIDVVCGSSVGAINAAAVAAGMADHLEARWLEIRTLDVLSPRMDLWRLPHWQAIAKLGNPLVRLVRDEILWDTIRKGHPKLVVETTNLLTGEHLVYDNDTCTWRHLLASAAIPMIFSPVRIGDDYHVDGSLTQITPLLPAIQRGADTLYVVALTCDKPEARPPDNLYEMAGRVLEIFLHNSLHNDLLHLERINSLVERGLDKAHRIVKAIPLFPSRELGEIASFLTFSREHIEELIQLGYEDARKAFAPDSA
jgi:NTE family protein